jgi:hypothetical protein
MSIRHYGLFIQIGAAAVIAGAAAVALGVTMALVDTP